MPQIYHAEEELHPIESSLSPGAERDIVHVGSVGVPLYSGEFWTSRQRQASSLHEISYRACFKPQLPRYFIERFSGPGDLVYDPFMGRGTTLVEAALLGRAVVGNDVNPLSIILTEPRLRPPELGEIESRLASIFLDPAEKAELDLSMFFHPHTEGELVSLKRYLRNRASEGRIDAVDRWIRMVTTNRLTGHSKGFLSVYTLPPNQAATQQEQRRINEKRRQSPEYRSVRANVLKKSRLLLKDITHFDYLNLTGAAETLRLYSDDAWNTPSIESDSVQLTVTSPPFLNVVDYSRDNWLRCWFNDIDSETVSRRVSVVRSVQSWSELMLRVFKELFRITKPSGYVAFEVGEVRNRKVKLDEYVIPVGLAAGFRCKAVLINRQRFTKTSNIWGIENNRKGTNTNRIVLFQKP